MDTNEVARGAVQALIDAGFTTLNGVAVEVLDRYLVSVLCDCGKGDYCPQYGSKFGVVALTDPFDGVDFDPFDGIDAFGFDAYEDVEALWRDHGGEA